MKTSIQVIKKLAARASIINLNVSGVVDFYIANFSIIPKFTCDIPPVDGLFQYNRVTGEFSEYTDNVLSYIKYSVSFNDLTLAELLDLEATSHVRLQNHLINHTDDSVVYEGYYPTIPTPNKHLLKTPFNNGYVIMR